jgi:hypothetical protein
VRTILTRENVTSYVIATLPNEDLDDYDIHAIVDGVVAYLPGEYGFGTMVYDDCCLNHWLDTHLDEDAYWKLVEKNYRLSSGELPS